MKTRIMNTYAMMKINKILINKKNNNLVKNKFGRNYRNYIYQDLINLKPLPLIIYLRELH